MATLDELEAQRDEAKELLEEAEQAVRIAEEQREWSNLQFAVGAGVIGGCALGAFTGGTTCAAAAIAAAAGTTTVGLHQSATATENLELAQKRRDRAKKRYDKAREAYCKRLRGDTSGDGGSDVDADSHADDDDDHGADDDPGADDDDDHGADDDPGADDDDDGMSLEQQTAELEKQEKDLEEAAEQCLEDPACEEEDPEDQTSVDPDSSESEDMSYVGGGETSEY